MLSFAFTPETKVSTAIQIRGGAKVLAPAPAVHAAPLTGGLTVLDKAHMLPVDGLFPENLQTPTMK